MAKNCIQRLEHMFLKEKLEKYREMLKDTEKSFKDNSELITRITEIQYKMNSIKGAQS
jgi:DNA anti-recombination protein RmuC